MKGPACVSALIVVLLASSMLDATVMIQIVTPDGIVLASDSKMTDSSGNYIGDTTKIIVLSRTVAVASCDMSYVRATITDKRTLKKYDFDYDFHSWIKKFRKPADSQAMTDAIMKRIPQTFANYDVLMKAQAFSERPLLVEYYVAGYTKQSVPIVNKITIPLDWANHAVGSAHLDVIHPLPGTDTDFKFNAGCEHAAVDTVTRKQGKPYARARELEPIILDKLFAGKDLTIDEAKKLATAMVRVEAEFNPALVGLPVHLVVINKPSAPSR